MRREPFLALATAALLLASPALAEGQEAEPRMFGAGWMTGPTFVTSLNNDAGEGATDLEPGLGVFAALHVDRWIGPDHRFGLRVHGAYERPRFEWAPGERKVHALGGGLSLLLRLTTPDDEGSVTPYVAAGGGITWYDLGAGPQTNFAAADAYHDGESHLLPTGLLGLGVDIPIAWDWNRRPVQIRVEAADHVTFSSPLWSLSDDERHGAVHHIRLSVGMHATVPRW